MSCKTFNLTKIPGTSGLCRAERGPYGPTEEHAGAVIATKTPLGQPVIIPDPFAAPDDPPHPYVGASLGACSVMDYYSVPTIGSHGATFDTRQVDALRRHLAMGENDMYLNLFANEPGVLCMRIRHSAQREAMIEELASECPGPLTSEQCEAVVHMLEAMHVERESRMTEWLFLASLFILPHLPQAIQAWKQLLGRLRPPQGPDGPSGPSNPTGPQGGPEETGDGNEVHFEAPETPLVVEVPWYEAAWDSAGDFVSDNQEGIRNGLIAATVTLVVVDAVLVADDATVVGVADDPALLGTVPATVVVGGLALLFGASMSDITGAVEDATAEVL